jgi:hypothetical protein
MSFIERFGLGALFVLCGLILIVGLFGEDEAAAAHRRQDKSAKAGFRAGNSKGDREREWNNLRPAPSPLEKRESLILQPESKSSPRTKKQPKVAKTKNSHSRKKQVSKTRASKTRMWKVRSGDSLARIAQRSYGRQGPKVLRFLAKANGMKVRQILKLGKILKVPPLPASFRKKTTRAVR